MGLAAGIHPISRATYAAAKDMAPYVAQHLERFLRKLRELVDDESGMIVVIR
jgi:hypothetical protein